MESIPSWILVLVSASAGAVLAWFVTRQRQARAIAEAESRSTSERTELRTRLEEKQLGIDRLEASLLEERSHCEELRRTLAASRVENASLQSNLENLRASTEEKLALLDEARKKLGESFEALSARSLKSNTAAFFEVAREKFEELRKDSRVEMETRQKAIGDLVKPIQETLKTVGETVGELEKARIGAYRELRQQVGDLLGTQKQLRSETANLVKALRSPTVRGRWGEIQLKRVVEMAGMLAHCDFLEQHSVGTEDGGRLRPDLIVRLPGEKNVVVDAKAPLAAYLDALEAQDEEARAAHLRDHARQVRDHVQKLGQKSYWDQFQPAPEFVVMFLPGETFFAAALQQDPSLLEFGVHEQVILASPTTLISLLKAVAYGWRQENVAESARVIRDLGKELHDRIRVVANHVGKVGGHLDRAVESYNQAVGSLETRVLVTARRFRELGAAGGKEIESPPTLDKAARELRPELLRPDTEGGTTPDDVEVAAGEPDPERGADAGA